ncbi:hypothetical protein HNP02_004464 [Mycobacterium sp. AZCC_0083]|nr:hypothetical protein [Mycobacterium sp. AZCC_0083]
MTSTVLVFDVNETLLDITALEPVFAKIFGDPRVRRGERSDGGMVWEWFGQAGDLLDDAHPVRRLHRLLHTR